jgi:tetratricopeptide (TPR) repeat protein
LLTSQKILEHLACQEDFLQLVIITLLATTYFGLGEYRRTIRYLESWEDFIVGLDRKTEPANVKQWQLILHFMSLLGDCQLAEGHCEKSIEIYNQVTRNYNQASLLISQQEGKENMTPFYNCELNLPNEAFSFGSDEYLKVWVNLAECLMRTNQFEKAAEKYETVKKRI